MNKLMNMIKNVPEMQGQDMWYRRIGGDNKLSVRLDSAVLLQPLDVIFIYEDASEDAVTEFTQILTRFGMKSKSSGVTQKGRTFHRITLEALSS